MADAKFYDPGPPVECAEEGCKALFHRPQDAPPALSLESIAQLHGWKIADKDLDTLHCPMHTGAVDA